MNLNGWIDLEAKRPTTRKVVTGRFPVPGFTLIELMTVIVIMVTFAAIAMPRYGNSLARYRAESAARRIASDLTYARAAARSGSAPKTVEFKPGSAAYTVTPVVGVRRNVAGYEVHLWEEPYHATLDLADFGGDAIVVFSGFGIPDSGGTAVVTSGVCTKTVTLDAATGSIAITDGP